MEKSIKKIGTQLYTVREYMKTPKDIAETFNKVRKIGYEVVQFSGAPIGDAKELRKMADDAGIRIICTHIPYADFKDNPEKVAEEHRIIGATHAGLGMMPMELFRDGEGAAEFAKDFDKIAKALKNEGIGTTYHNHRMEFQRVGGKTVMEIMLENSECFTLMLDTFWVQSGGADPVDFIRKHKNRIELIHFKDMQIIGNEQHMSEVMEGNLNWNGIINEVLDSDIEYAFVEQDICRRDPFESLEISYNNLKSFLEG